MLSRLAFFLLPALVSAAPVISSFNPSAGPPNGGVQVTINGSGLDDNDPPLGDEDPTVTFGGIPVTIVGDPSPTKIVFILPAGSGTNKQVGVSLDGAQPLPGGDFELSFSTDASETYGVFYSEDVVSFTLVGTAAGTGGDVTATVTPPNPAATRRFWVVTPIELPSGPPPPSP